MLYDDDGKNSQLVKLIGTNFVSRRNVKAIQNDDGSWMPVREDSRDPNSPLLPWTMQDFKIHLSGQRTYGHYMLDENNNCKLFAYDLDVMQPTAANGLTWTDENGAEYDPREVWMAQDVAHPEYRGIRDQLRGMANALCLAMEDLLGADVRVAVCDTGGKGLHVYALYGMMPAEVARQVAVGVLDELGHFAPSKGDNFFRYDNPDNPGGYDKIEVEIFPKQSELTEGGFGNLMALPCGKHRKTDREREFVTFKGVDMDDGWRALDPIEALSGGKVWD